MRRRVIERATVVFLTVCVLGPVAYMRSQAPQAPAQDQGLVIHGGALVDVRRGTLVPNSVIMILGERITQVGAAGQVTVPSGAQVVKADGKFVMPGIWDTHAHTRDFDAVLNINHGRAHRREDR